MARILFGWELGSNRGHIAAMEAIAATLLDAGHEVVFALQQIDAGGIDLDRRIALWQAPIWPRLLAAAAQPISTPTATMGDILCRLGLDRPGTLAALIRGWDAIFAAVRPDLVVGDFAPALLAAARGRIVSVQTGTGFACPPPGAESFPHLSDAPLANDEREILDLVDADLDSVGRRALPALPALFASDHSLIASFAELDPYAATRPGSHCTPGIAPPLPTPGASGGEELFVYLFHKIHPETPIWEGLALSGRKVRIHMSGPSDAHRALFKRNGFAVETRPMPFPRIAARSRMVLSHGGHGFVSASLLSGLPQIIAWYDLEKKLYGDAIATAGLGRPITLFSSSAQDVAAEIEACWNDAAMADRCRAAAPGFAERMDDPVSARVRALAEQL